MTNATSKEICEIKVNCIGETSCLTNETRLNPRNISPLAHIPFPVCFDSRKDECPFAIEIKIDNKSMNLHQIFCGYSCRK